MIFFTLSQFIPLMLFERNLFTVALIYPLKRQGEQDLANQPVAGAALLFSFENDDSSTAVLIVRQRIPIAGLLNSRTIFFVDTNNIGNTPIKCKGVVVAYCSSRRLKCNKYTDDVICVWDLGAILSRSSNLTIINKIRSIIISYTYV